MELKISKEKLIEVLEKYYKEEKDFTGKVTIKASIGYVGYGMQEHIGCILDMKITGELDFLGDKIPSIKRITSNDIEEAFKFYLEKEEYQLSNLSINSGVNDVLEGYGLGEHTVQKAYFKGVTVTVKEKGKVKKIGGK